MRNIVFAFICLFCFSSCKNRENSFDKKPILRNVSDKFVLDERLVSIMKSFITENNADSCFKTITFDKMAVANDEKFWNVTLITLSKGTETKETLKDLNPLQYVQIDSLNRFYIVSGVEPYFTGNQKLNDERFHEKTGSGGISWCIIDSSNTFEVIKLFGPAIPFYNIPSKNQKPTEIINQ